jgi:N-acetylglutamate synthase-like GNAT family acetyltransferase
MNSKNNSFDVDSLRETLGYSIQFVGKLFCIIIDAESFNNYDCNQLVQDLLLVVHSCDTRIIVVVGCFPFRTGKKKKQASLGQIRYASEAVKKQFGPSAATVKLSGEWQKSLSRRLGIVLKRQVAIVPAIQEPFDVLDTKQILSSFGSAVGQDQIAKLIILSSHDGIIDQNGDFLHQVQSDLVQDLINKGIVAGELTVISQTALLAISNNIRRVHIVNGAKSGGLLAELFTKDGIGTMIFSGQYIEVRPALPEDLNGIRSLMSLDASQNLSAQCCEGNVEQFLVAAIDDYVVACARLQHFVEAKKSFVSSLVVNPDYSDRGIQLLAQAGKIASSKGSDCLLLGLPKIVPWWIPPEFEVTESSAIPKELRGELKSPTILSRDISS